jgi:hypothetical protein
VKILCWSFCVAPAKNLFKSTKDVANELSLNRSYKIHFLCIFEQKLFEKIQKHTLPVLTHFHVDQMSSGKSQIRLVTLSDFVLQRRLL